MIELASVIGQLREELTRAITSAEDEPLHFELGPIELELSVALERTGNAAARVRFWVVDSKAEGKVGALSTQRIKLTLQPALRDSERLPFVDGIAEAGEL